MQDNSIPYLILQFLFLFVGIFEIYYPQYKRKIQGLECVLFVCFFGFRGYVGTDWSNYYDYYTSLGGQWNLQRYEPGFSLLANVCNTLGLDYQSWVFLLVAIQGILFDAFFSRKVKYMFLAYIVTIAIFPNLIIDTLRNFLSILIGLIAIEEKNKKQMLKAFICLMLSVSFHLSGLIFLFLFPLTKFYINKKVIYVLFAIGFFIFFLQVSFFRHVIYIVGRIIGGQYEVMANLYLNAEEHAYGVSLGIIEKIFIFFLVMYKYDSIVKAKVIDKYIFNIFILYVLCQFYLSEMSFLITRFAVLFFAGYVVVLSSIISIYKEKSNKIFIAILLLFLCLLKTFIGYNSNLYTYRNVIFQKDSLIERKYNIDEHYGS